jgi:hypothetical protein
MKEKDSKTTAELAPDESSEAGGAGGASGGAE